ncbi:unnamed protein product [Clavelina lepadiformis]|uniref:Uncharacterized protein n=1 Tax=Clavelina lepadiformis TaxID=159417 RepID=A0ABP0FAR3_CLALP
MQTAAHCLHKGQAALCYESQSTLAASLNTRIMLLHNQNIGQSIVTPVASLQSNPDYNYSYLRSWTHAVSTVRYLMLHKIAV